MRSPRHALAFALGVLLSLVALPAIADDVASTPPITPATREFGSAGWLGLLAAVVLVLVRLIKTNALDAALARFGIPSVPKRALPWLALVLGLAGAILEAKLGGVPWSHAAQAGLWGVLSGAVAIGLQETAPTLVRPVIGTAATNVAFGVNAGPNPGPAPPQPSLRPPPAEGAS